MRQSKATGPGPRANAEGVLSPLAAQRRDLYALCKRFILDNEITCSETIYQMDHVIGSAYELIDEICAIIGYAEPTEKPDEEDDPWN